MSEKKLLGKQFLSEKNFIGGKICWKNICQKKDFLGNNFCKKDFIGKNLYLKKNYWKFFLSESGGCDKHDLICIFVYQMGRLCRGAHEISDIKAPLFLHGWVVCW